MYGPNGLCRKRAITPGRTKVCSSMRCSFSSGVIWKRRSIACLDHAEEGGWKPVTLLDEQRTERLSGNNAWQNSIFVRELVHIPPAEECALMKKKDQARKQYPSDLTDEQWAIMAPLIPPAKQSPRGGHPRTVDMREVLNTLFYLNRSGCQWDMLPHDLLPKSTVYDYFAQWRDDGTWTKMVQ